MISPCHLMGAKAMLLMSMETSSRILSSHAVMKGLPQALRYSTNVPGSKDETPKHDDTFIAPHPGLKRHESVQEWGLSSPIYQKEYLESVKPKHLPADSIHQKAGFLVVQVARRFFDWASNYGPNMTEANWLRRIIFLETVAGVPGMVGGMLRHLKSLRSMKRDNGWIHTLLEEAENERMHLLTFFQLRQPGFLFRSMVIVAQGVFFNAYFIAYLLSPKACHCFVGYLEEEAVLTYTHCLKDIDLGKLWNNKPAPQIGIDYWKLQPGATMRDVILAVRADEACHSHVNHTFAALPSGSANPFTDTASQLP